MAKKTLIVACVLLLFGASLYLVRPVFGCGPFFPEAIFTYATHPDPPLENFLRGDLGVLQPTYARSYLYVAYRHLAGMGFDPEQQKVVLALWNERLGVRDSSAAEKRGQEVDWVQNWLNTRAKVLGIRRTYELDSYREAVFYSSERKSNVYVGYYNCLPDAFLNAVNTLSARIKQFGLTSPEVSGWVQAQDQVFANCKGPDPITGKPHLPENSQASAHPILQADRSYQIAAAHFYAGNFDTARLMFENIAQDASSPWRKTAHYLIARALIRKATLMSEYEKSDLATLAQADVQLRRILKDPNLNDFHPAAHRLLGFVRLRLHPRERLRELARTLLEKNAGRTLRQDLWDYTVLLDKFFGIRDEYEPRKILEKQARIFVERPEVREQDDLTDWVITFQTSGGQAVDHAAQEWAKKRSLPWLVAAISKVSAGHGQVPFLLAATESVDPASPAFATLAFHRLRLLAETGKKEEARAELDGLLSGDHARFSLSSLNLLLALRMKIARNLDEFLQYAPRVPTGIAYDMDPLYSTANVWQEKGQEPSNGEAWFDADSARILTERMPLGLLKEAATTEILPESLRRDIALAAWSRAVVLDEEKVGNQLVPILETLLPKLKPHLHAYLSADTSAARRFAGVYAILKFPGMRPYVRAGVGRKTSFPRIDNYRDNWWCSFAPRVEKPYWPYNWYEMWSSLSGPVQTLYRNGEVDFPDFLTENEKAAAKQEWEKLTTVPTAPNYLGHQVIEWAKKNPSDPRVPEALHFVLRSTRYGCVDKETSKFRRAAFGLLHRRYPKSIWATRPH